MNFDPPRHSDDALLMVTMRFAREGHAYSCAKLLLKVAERLRSGKAVPDDVTNYFADSLVRVADNPEVARAFLKQGSGPGRRPKTVEAWEVYCAIEDLRSKHPGAPLVGDKGEKNLCTMYARCVHKSPDHVKGIYYKGKKLCERIVAEIAPRIKYKGHASTIENARLDK